METAKQNRSDTIPVFFPSIAPHLRESAVLKMLHEEEPTGKVRGSQWPPADSAIGHKPSSFFTKVSRGQGGRPVEWPPRPSQEENKQVSSSESNDAPAPPVPPRPANYPQATMDPSQQQQMVSQQQQVQQQQQQQHRQQVTSSSEMRTVKQTYHVQQHQTYQQQYQQQGHQIDGFQQQMVQQPQQQSVQYQMSQQTSSSAFHQLPAHNQHPTPAQPMPSVFQNGSPAPTQARTAPAPAPGPAPAPAPAPNPPAAAPQYANQNGTAPPHAPAPQEGTPEPASILPQYQAAPGYSTAYTAVHGEWPPKVNLGSTPTNPPPPPTKNENAPNMTTTYPSGFKLRERAPVEQAPARVVTSQPAFKMTQPIRKSGDSKWPPKGNMEPTQQEVREFIKPRKSNKDYSEFFAQNALPHNYAAYRPPPGTQHHGLLEEGVSNM